MLVMWRTAMRLGDLIHPERHSVRADLTWVLRGVEYMDPPPHLLRAARPGDAARLSAGSTKPDQFGEQHAAFASVLPYDDTDTNAAKRLRDMELHDPCHGAARQTRPLFATADGRVLTHSPLDRRLHELLHHCFGSATANTHSWHSMRVGLACALHAAGASDATIQLLCRWLSPDSLRLYRRLGTQESVRWVDAAEQARVDTLQQTNVPAVDSCEAFGALLHDNERDVVARENAIRNLLGTQPAGPQRGKKRREPGEADPEETRNSPSSAPQRGKRPREPCEDDPEEDEDALQPPPSDTSPLTTANAQGRWVLSRARLGLSTLAPNAMAQDGKR